MKVNVLLVVTRNKWSDETRWACSLSQGQQSASWHHC